jgi:hypothetical protein
LTDRDEASARSAIPALSVLSLIVRMGSQVSERAV